MPGKVKLWSGVGRPVPCLLGVCCVKLISDGGHCLWLQVRYDSSEVTGPSPVHQQVDPQGLSIRPGNRAGVQAASREMLLHPGTSCWGRRSRPAVGSLSTKVLH